MMMVMMVIMFLMIYGNNDYNSDDDDGDNNSDYRPVWTVVDDKEMITTGNNLSLSLSSSSWLS